MTYSTSDIKARVASMRRAFLIRAATVFTIMLASLILIILNLNKTLTFILIVIEFPCLLYAIRIFEKFSPFVLFSGEIKGTNIKEDEYTVTHKSGPGMRYKQVGAPSFGGPPIAPSTGANKRRTPPAMRAAVYLRTEDGDVVMLRGLYRAHADIYEEGDVLCKPAGAKYPMIISREADRQPCPLCGEVNSSKAESCSGCGIGIES